MDSNEKKLEVKEEARIRFLGSNQKNILLVVQNSDVAFVDDEDLEFTGKWLGAIGLSLADVAILNMEPSPKTSSDIKNEFSPIIIFLLGTGPEQIGLPLYFPFYQVQKYDGITYLSTPELKILEANKEEKKKFWSCLQTLFPKK